MLGPRFPRPLLLQRWVVPHFREGAGGKSGGPGRGLRTVTVVGVGVGVCMDLGARLGLRGRRGTPRVGYYVMQQCIAASLRPDSRDVGEKGPLSYFPFKRILLATVFLGCFSSPRTPFLS